MELLSIELERATLQHRWTTAVFTGATIADLDSVKQSMAQYWGEISVELRGGEIHLVTVLENKTLAIWGSRGLLSIHSN